MTRRTLAGFRTALVTGLTALALPAIVCTQAAGAQSDKVDGVAAYLKHGTLVVKGGDQSSNVALRLEQGDSNTIQVDVGDDNSADFSFARSEVEEINVRMGDGNDRVKIDDANGAFTTTIPTTIAGGAGNDDLEGGLGAETFRGGDGNDFVDGRKGADTAYLGAGDDTFRWDNGDGSDVIEGQDGSDTMLFNGAQGDENVTMSPNNGRLTFFRQQGNVTMDTDGVEIVDFNALGGHDNVLVHDLSTTDVRQTNLDLAGALGGNAADNVADSVTVEGTNGDDNIAATGSGSNVDVTGLANTVSVKHADSNDTLAVNTLTGADNVQASGVTSILHFLINGIVQ
jgi:Ca2+-binding RTX toxin-like protein